MSNPIVEYFAEFKILRRASKDFWLTNFVQFFDGLAYFAMIYVLTLYFTDMCGFSDMDSGYWVGIYTFFVTAFTFAVGAVCDVIGIKKTIVTGIIMMVVGRTAMGMAPEMFADPESVRNVVRGSVFIVAMGSAFTGPVMLSAIRRYTTKDMRSMGFNVYYIMMNLGAFVASYVVINWLRNGSEFRGFEGLGNNEANMYIINVAVLFNLCALVCALCLNTNNYADPTDKFEDTQQRSPLSIFLEVWKEKTFQKLLIFVGLTLGVRLVFTQQFMLLPKYFQRTVFKDVELGTLNAINPLLIVVGLFLIIPLLKRCSTVKLMLWGMSISAGSALLMMVPAEWYLAMPGVNNISQAFILGILLQIVVFSVGELLFSPRFSEYVASVAPKDKVASYMAISALPMFIAKPINAIISGIVLSVFCYDGVRGALDIGDLAYTETPQCMWCIYFAMAVVTPIAIWLFRDKLTSRPADEVNAEAAATAPPDPSRDVARCVSIPPPVNYVMIVKDGLVLTAVCSAFAFALHLGVDYLKIDNIDGHGIVSEVRKKNDWIKKSGAAEKMAELSAGKALVSKILAEMSEKAGGNTLLRQNTHGLTALMEVCNVNYNKQQSVLEIDATSLPFVQLLVEQGADVHAKDKRGWTPLAWACWSGMPAVVSELVKCGADTQMRDVRGNTLLMLAAMRGNAEVVEYLLKNGADDSAKNEAGLTALVLAQRERDSRVRFVLPFVGDLAGGAVRLPDYDKTLQMLSHERN